MIIAYEDNVETHDTSRFVGPSNDYNTECCRGRQGWLENALQPVRSWLLDVCPYGWQLQLSEHALCLDCIACGGCRCCDVCLPNEFATNEVRIATVTGRLSPTQTNEIFVGDSAA